MDSNFIKIESQPILKNSLIINKFQIKIEIINNVGFLWDFLKKQKGYLKLDSLLYMVVATPRIELGTQGFSVPCSTN